MELPEIYRALGRERFDELTKTISMGSLKTYGVFDSFKIHARLHKLNRERLRKAVNSFWTRIESGDQDLARELSQAVLVSNLKMVAEILDFLEIPHDGNGFFEKNTTSSEQLKDGWQERTFKEFREKYGEPLVLLYVNHLAWELSGSTDPFVPNRA